MGGCATKPKVSKDDVDGKTKAPEPEPEPEQPKEDAVLVNVESKVVGAQDPQNLNVQEIVDDDQANKRRSLSFLFKENEDTKVSTENGKTRVEETTRQEALEAEKPLEDTKSNEPIVKLESPKAEGKLSGESKNNEPAKQESAEKLTVVEEKSPEQNQSNKPEKLTVVKEKSPEQNQSNKPETSEAEKPSEETQSNEAAKEIVKPESEAEKPSEKNNQSSEPLKQESQETKETSSEEPQSNEPIKQEPLSRSTDEPSEARKPSGESEENDSIAEKPETPIEETINTEVVPLPQEKVIEVVLPNAEPVEKITEEATSSTEEKNHIGVDHTSKAADAASET